MLGLAGMGGEAIGTAEGLLRSFNYIIQCGSGVPCRGYTMASSDIRVHIGAQKVLNYAHLCVYGLGFQVMASGKQPTTKSHLQIRMSNCKHPLIKRRCVVCGS